MVESGVREGIRVIIRGDIGRECAEVYMREREEGREMLESGETGNERERVA